MSNPIPGKTPESMVEPEVLDKYLRGGSSYSELYKGLENDAVPPDLDADILAHARSAVQSRKGFAWQRLAPIVAIAATAVLTISIVMQSAKDPILPRISDGARSDSPERVAAREIAPAAPLPAEPKLAAVPLEVEAKPALKLDAPAGRVANESSQDRPKAKQESLQYAPAASPPAPAATRASEQLEAVEVQSNIIRQAPQDAALPVEVLSSEELAKMSNNRAGPRGTVVVPEKAVGVNDKARSASGQQSALEEVMVTGSFIPANQVGAGPRGNVRVSTSTIEERRAERDARKEETNARESNPVFWLDYIRELRRAGKNVEADREWDRFVKAYPNYTVDERDAARPKKAVR